MVFIRHCLLTAGPGLGRTWQLRPLAGGACLQRLALTEQVFIGWQQVGSFMTESLLLYRLPYWRTAASK